MSIVSRSTNLNTPKTHSMGQSQCLYLDPLYALLFYDAITFCFLFIICFLFFPISGARSLAGGRREYGRSGREPLYYYYIFFYMLLLHLFHTCCLNHLHLPLSRSTSLHVDDVILIQSMYITFNVLSCFHIEFSGTSVNMYKY